MSRPGWLVLGGAFVVALVVLAALTLPGGTAQPSPTAGGSGGLEPATTATAPPTADSSSPHSAAAASAGSSPPSATAPPRTSAKPALAYAAFVKRVNDDRATVERLNQDLSSAVQAEDLATSRTASVAILDFTDGEHDWLRENPPADCYATAHAAAGSMLDAYGAAADGFIKWADTGGGLDGLVALGDAVSAAQDAADSLTAFGNALDATVCPS